MMPAWALALKREVKIRCRARDPHEATGQDATVDVVHPIRTSLANFGIVRATCPIALDLWALAKLSLGKREDGLRRLSITSRSEAATGPGSEATLGCGWIVDG